MHTMSIFLPHRKHLFNIFPVLPGSQAANFSFFNKSIERLSTLWCIPLCQGILQEHRYQSVDMDGNSGILLPRGWKMAFAIYMRYTRRFTLNSWKAFLAWYSVETNTRYCVGQFPTTSELLVWFNWNLKGMENFCQYEVPNRNKQWTSVENILLGWLTAVWPKKLLWPGGEILASVQPEQKGFLSTFDISPAPVTQWHWVKPWQLLSKLISPATPGHYN